MNRELKFAGAIPVMIATNSLSYATKVKSCVFPSLAKIGHYESGNHGNALYNVRRYIRVDNFEESFYATLDKFNFSIKFATFE